MQDFIVCFRFKKPRGCGAEYTTHMESYLVIFNSMAKYKFVEFCSTK